MIQDPDHLYTSIALYDWDGDLDVREFHAIATAFFELNGVTPNDACLSCGDRDRGGSYKRVTKLLAAETLPPDATLSLVHMLPDSVEPLRDWDVSAELMYVSSNKTIYLGCDMALANVDLVTGRRLVEALARHVKLRYGIGYARTVELGPELYAHGIVSGLGYSDADMAEADRTGSWFNERIDFNRHLQGLLRDVYPLNVLSAPHLAQPVGGVPLGEWIAARLRVAR